MLSGSIASTSHYFNHNLWFGINISLVVQNTIVSRCKYKQNVCVEHVIIIKRWRRNTSNKWPFRKAIKWLGIDASHED